MLRTQDFPLPRAGWAVALARLDRSLLVAARALAPHALRLALGLVFLWFGALKVVGRSPVEELVAQTVPFVPQAVLVPLLGVWEVTVGLGLITGLFLRLVLLLFWAQMAGTFLVLVVQPEIAFQGANPLLLTTEGEFVIKNLVLVAAGLVVASTLKPLGPREEAGARPGGRP